MHILSLLAMTAGLVGSVGALIAGLNARKKPIDYRNACMALAVSSAGYGTASALQILINVFSHW